MRCSACAVFWSSDGARGGCGAQPSCRIGNGVNARNQSDWWNSVVRKSRVGVHDFGAIDVLTSHASRGARLVASIGRLQKYLFWPSAEKRHVLEGLMCIASASPTLTRGMNA